MTTMQLEEIRIMSLPEIVGNAIIEADSMGVALPMTPKSTVMDVVCMVLDGLECSKHPDAGHKHAYWLSNFIIVGLL